MLRSRLGRLRRQLNLEGMLMLVLRSRWRRSASLLLCRSILARLDLDLGLSLGLRVSVDGLMLLHLLARHLHVRVRRR